MDLKIISSDLFQEYEKSIADNPISQLERLSAIETPVDYFDFYKSISSVYSSKIEGETIAYDSFFKYKFLNVKFRPDYTKKADDLFCAYSFIENKDISIQNLQKAHSILTNNILPESQQGLIRVCL